MNSSKNFANIAMNSILNFPNGIGNGSLSLSYDYPFHSVSNTGTVASQISTKLGNVGLKQTLAGRLYETVETIANNFTNITSTAAMLESHLTPGDIGVQINTADGTLKAIEDNVGAIKSSLVSLMELLGLLDLFGAKFAQVLYGMSLAVSLSIILGVFFMRICKMIKCRFFLHLLCFMTFFICLLVFLLAILLSLISPSLFYTCDYIDSVFSSPS